MLSTLIGTKLDNNKNLIKNPEADNVEEDQYSVMEKPKVDEVEEYKSSVPSKKKKMINMTHKSPRQKMAQMT